VNPLQRLFRLFASPASEPRPDDLVLLGRPTSEAEAELWRNILSQWGVHSLIKNVSALAYIRLGDMFEVWVLQHDLEYALELVGLGDGQNLPEDQAVHDGTGQQP